MLSRPVALLRCLDPESYALAVRASIRASESKRCMVPVIARESDSLDGFPLGIEVGEFPASEEKREASTVVPWSAPDPGLRWCIGGPEPTCQAAARLLGGHTGRRVLCIDEDEAWEREIRAIYESDASTSVAFLIPGWRAQDGRCTPEWLKRTLVLMRSLHARVGSRPWGILTAATPAVLTQVVAKSLLQVAVAQRYASSPGFVLTTDERAGALPRYGAGSQRFVHSFARGAIDDRSVLRLTEISATFLAVSSHGRSYCAAEGLLCGARAQSASPGSAVTKCVLGMDCVDPSYPQIDPRRYDTPVLVLDCCSSANWSSPVWETGLPSIAYYAIAGSASALLVGDGLAHVPHNSSFDHVWALLTSSTLGEAVVRMNAVRPTAAGAFPYFLLGDPDILAGPRRWQSWVNEPALVHDGGATSPGYRTTLPAASEKPAFDRLLIPTPVEFDGNWTLQSEGADDVLTCCGQYLHGDNIELWFQREPLDRARELHITRRPALRMPPSIIASAQRIRDLTGAWTIPFDKGRRALMFAADAALALDEKIALRRGHVSFDSVEGTQAAISAAIARWCEAQKKCCDSLLDHKRAGLPPAYLWNTDNWRGRTVSTPCECCGLSPTIERAYGSPPGPSRIWSECNRCDITSDRPLVDGFPSIVVAAPSEVQVGRRATVTISIAGDSSESWYGAGFASMVHQNHGVISTPATFELSCHPGVTVEKQIELTLPEPPLYAHLYRFVAVILLNGYAHWSCRLILVRKSPIDEQPALPA